MAILSHHDLLATDDIDAGGKALEALGVLAHQLSREGEDVGGFATEESLGGNGLEVGEADKNLVRLGVA